MSAQPLTCPLTLATLLAPNSLLRTIEGCRLFPFLVLWTHESLSSRDPSAGPLLRPSGGGVGWAVPGGAKCAQGSCQEDSLVSTNSCCHRTHGTNRDAPKAPLNLGGSWSAGAA